MSPSYMCTLARTLHVLGTAALAHVRRTARMCTPITTQAVDQADGAPVGIQPLTFTCTPTSPRGSWIVNVRPPPEASSVELPNRLYHLPEGK